ncbi:MAG: hypothetical protein ACRD2N_14690 [Vicinamibacterales bacterium]
MHSILDHDVVDDAGQARVANERAAKGRALQIAVGALAKRDDLIGRERVDDCDRCMDRFGGTKFLR